jgi:hypothetical protein
MKRKKEIRKKKKTKTVSFIAPFSVGQLVNPVFLNRVIIESVAEPGPESESERMVREHGIVSDFATIQELDLHPWSVTFACASLSQPGSLHLVIAVDNFLVQP